MKPSYVVYALPRSRTFWLSRFLCYKDWLCAHDQLAHCRSLADVDSWLAMPCTGSVETAAAPYWRLAKGVKAVTIRRPVADVVASILRVAGNAMDEAALWTVIRKHDRKLDQIERRVPGVLSLPYDALADEGVCKGLFEYLLPYPFDRAWWQRLDGLNLQINFHHMLRHFVAHRPQLDKLAQAAKHKTIADLTFEPVDRDDGIVIREERFREGYADFKRLTKEHLMATGESPAGLGVDGDPVNVGLLETLDDLGCLHVTTARSNGRAFGYLISIIGPSLESPEIKVATHTAFYAAPEFKGLGMRMQRAAIEMLKAKGVDEVHMRAGIRGVAERAAVLYRRLGAEPFGSLHRLRLNPLNTSTS